MRCIVQSAVAFFVLSSVPAEAQTMGLASKSETVTAKVFLDGAIKSTGEASSQNSVATGAISIALASSSWEFTTSLNIAAKRDTITRSPGQSILSPGTGGFASGLVDVNWYFLSKRSGAPEQLRERLAMRSYMSISSLLWDLTQPTETAKRAEVANAAGLGLGLRLKVAEGKVGTGDKAPVIGVALDAGRECPEAS